jgi:4-alpha-glucanotransferase
MKFNRSSGIILHPSSLPGPDGIGDLGPEAYHWVDFLSQCGCSLWQMLPLGPTGYGDSPYQCFSAFPGNPYLISPIAMLEDNLLTRDDLVDRPDFPEQAVLFGEVIPWKIELLNRAYARFQSSQSHELQKSFDEFQEIEASWLHDYAIFMAIKDAYAGQSWKEWPLALRNRDQRALSLFQQERPDAIKRHIFRQFLFFHQWKALQKYANLKNVNIIGDIPLYISFDSVEAWAHPELFFFDENKLPTAVAGVPPDYFSPTGQLWGNPLYRWEYHRKTDYQWWLQRIKASLKIFDILRLDHFRGFAGYWKIPAGMPTAEIGNWEAGPGKHFFYVVQQQLGDLPIIAEDLGEITPEVDELRDTFHLPGMKIIQFSFSTDSTNDFLPHNYSENCAAYTGTHDNDTIRGWYDQAPEIEQDFCRRYLSCTGDDISWDLIRAVWSSVAEMALAPIQDFLSLGSNARMNYPGTPSGNWTWRLQSEALNDNLVERINDLNSLYGRSPHNG